MKLADLHVLHLEGTTTRLAPEHVDFVREQGLAWVIGTCQRTVVAVVGRAAIDNLQGHCPAMGGARHFDGTEAYAFLLRFACGLESRLVGEAEIFGQVKESWRLFSSVASLQSRQLDGIVQGLFRDVKEIRAQHISGIGSASYGSQVRRLLGEPAPGPTLLLGAGQLAQAVAPWIGAGELLLWNRNPERARELARHLQERHPERHVEVIEGEAAELAAWERAGDVIACIPVDAQRDPLRIAAWSARPAHKGRVVHLGLGEAGHAGWAGVPGLTTLVALFDMLRAQDEQRRVQVARARRSCAEKAVLRSLGSSATQPHGWEDLAAFSTLAP